MHKDSTPLVSICTTFFAAERFIHRVFDSCLNQTYQNIEIVVVDDASIDGSEKVVRKYAAKDSRIKYFRSDKKMGLSLSLLKMYELAGGEFVMMIGADDWLPRDYIENGVKSILAHPNVAGVVPRLTSLKEVSHDRFEFQNEVFESFSPPRNYSAEWFVQQMYRPTNLFVSALALMRREDAISSMNYFVKNYCENPSSAISEELRASYWGGFGVDAVMFLEILMRHKEFVFDSSLNHMKVNHGENTQFNIAQDSLYETVKYFYYYLLTFQFIYEEHWPRFYSEMKIFFGAQMLSSLLIYRVRHFGVRDGEDYKKSAVFARRFFSTFSGLEIIASFLRLIPNIIFRFLQFLWRGAFGHALHRPASAVFVKENFLDSTGKFSVV